jgi:hypothetical protein
LLVAIRPVNEVGVDIAGCDIIVESWQLNAGGRVRQHIHVSVVALVTHRFRDDLMFLHVLADLFEPRGVERGESESASITYLSSVQEVGTSCFRNVDSL